MGEHTFEEPLGGGLFALTGSEQFDVQHQGQVLSDQMTDDPLVLVS
jgi:hypothetical protein